MSSAATAHPIRLLRADDYDNWCALYRGYAEFYRQPMTDTILQQVWQWLTDGKLHGAIAETAAGAPAGLAHWEFILRPLRGAPLAYLHDLFVAQAQRGNGYGGQLLAFTGAQAAQRGCQNLRWLTKADNTIARLLYDKKADAAAEWVLYQQTINN